MAGIPAPGFTRLKAPGFTRLKAPGFMKSSSVAAAAKVPLPDDHPIDEGIVQKPLEPSLSKPQTQTRPPPKGIPTTSSLRQPKKTNLSNISKGQNFSNTHGPSPYERSKPQNSHIPYVGRKKTKGTLKAPESRPKNSTVTKVASNNAVEDDTKIKECKDVSTNGASVKPVKRQLIQPKSVSAQSGIARPVSSSGIVQSRGKKGQLPISKSRVISRSLQTLPQPAKTLSQKITKSSSSDNLSNGANPIPKPNGEKQNGPRKLGKPLNKPQNNFRTRASSHQSNQISTPYHQGHRLNKLTISPIDSNRAPGQDTAFNQPNDLQDTVDRTQDRSSSSFDMISNESQFPLNTTYNKVDRSVILYKEEPQIASDTTTIISDGLDKDNNNYLTDLNQTHVISNRTISKIDTIEPLQEMATNVKAMIKEDNSNALNDTDFLENQVMPYYEETDTALSIDNTSFTDDIAKVISAISSDFKISKPKSMSITEYPISQITPRKNSEEEGDNLSSIGNRCYTVSAAELRRSKVSRRNTFQAHDARFRIPKEINLHETLEGNILMDNTSFLQLLNDTRATKTMLLKLKRTLLEDDCPSPLVGSPLKRSNSCSVRRCGDPPLSPRISNSSPMAVVDPFSPTEPKDTEQFFSDVKENPDEKVKVESVTSLTEKFQASLRQIEELEKELDCSKYTIKLLQTQLETKEEKEQDMYEENIILREEVNHLTERLQKLTKGTSRERTLSSSGSYKDEFDLADTQSRKGILQRMYSNGANQE